MNSTFLPVAEWRDVTPERFRQEILPSGQPALLRGHVSAWPAVGPGRESPLGMANYLRGVDSSLTAARAGDAQLSRAVADGAALRALKRRY